MNVIEAQNVTKTYGDVTALDGLSLSVEQGATFGLLGTNGAGKTTLFKLLVGHIRQDEGELDVAGMNVAEAGLAIRRYIGYLPEQPGFPSSLTGREILRFHARIHGLPKGERVAQIDDVLATVGLSGAADRSVSGYSNGMRRRLGLGTALVARPPILLLDEPTAGLDPLGVAGFHRIIQRLHEETGLTVVLSSHVLSEVEELCDEVVVVHDGQVQASGNIGDLKQTLLADGVTLSLRLERPEEVARAVEIVTHRGNAVRTRRDRTLTVECSSTDPCDLLDAVRDEVAVAGYEIREPSLERVFERAVAADERRDGRVDEPQDGEVNA